MASPGFLYRRVARFAPCVFPRVGSGGLSLQSKYDIASLRDVFMSTHYWRAFEHLTSAPKLIVDLGAHCGHFSLLCHIGILERFGADSASYILVEALPALVPRIRRVIDEAGFADQVKIVQGLVGRKTGSANFEADPANLLSSRVTAGAAKGTALTYCDLDEIIPTTGEIDILKIDIEGSEYDLLQNYRSIFQRAKLLLVEVHGDRVRRESFERDLAGIGFAPLSPTIAKETESLLCYGRLRTDQTGGPAHAA